MAHKKKEYYKPGPMTEGKRNIIQGPCDLLLLCCLQNAADGVPRTMGRCFNCSLAVVETVQSQDLQIVWHGGTSNCYSHSFLCYSNYTGPFLC